MTYSMRTLKSCGPDALIEASCLPASRVDAAFDCADISEFRNSMDSPLDHKVACARLGLGHHVATGSEILSSTVRFPVIALFHAQGLVGSVLSQHWAVVTHVNEQGAWVAWGDGTVKCFKPGAFLDALTRGAPDYAYSLEGPPPSIRWWELALRWICRKLGY